MGGQVGGRIFMGPTNQKFSAKIEVILGKNCDFFNFTPTFAKNHFLLHFSLTIFANFPVFLRKFTNFLKKTYFHGAEGAVLEIFWSFAETGMSNPLTCGWMRIF